MNVSCTVRWAMAMALCGMTAVAYAGECQEEYGRDTKQINADHTQELKRCHGRGSAPCIKKANEKKATQLKLANARLIDCNRRDRPGNGPSNPGPPPGGTGGGPA